MLTCTCKTPQPENSLASSDNVNVIDGEPAHISQSFASYGHGGGGGGTLIFSYTCTRRLGPILWVHIFEFQYFWSISDKMNRVFVLLGWGVKIL